MRLHLVTARPTASVSHGFLPAADSLGLEVTLLTDRPEAYEAPAGPHPPPRRVVGCAVDDPAALIAAIGATGATGPPDAVFTNSDRLQTQVALAAEYFGLPGKDWRGALRARNKALMRRRLAESGVEATPAVELPPPRPGAGPAGGQDPIEALADQVGYPAVVKPRDGVASEDAFLVDSPAELLSRVIQIRARRPDRPLVAERYLRGGLRTLETLGDGTALRPLGGFATTLGAPPHFVEERLEWSPPAPPVTAAVLGRLAALGIGFGACHTEFCLDSRDGPGLVEVNDRIIGDHVDFLLADLLGVPVFEQVLRVHLGERLPPPPPPLGRHGIVEYQLPASPGVLTGVPGPADVELPGGIRLSYRPLRAAGEPVARTFTNRDYLAVIRATGPDPGRLAEAVAGFRAAHPVTIGPRR